MSYPPAVDLATTSGDPTAATLAIRERFRPFENARTAMLLVDHRGSIVLTNERLDCTFGYDRGELAGMPLEVLTPAAVRERHTELRRAFFEHPVTRQMGAAHDLFGVAKDGRQIPVEIGLTSFDVGDDRLVLAFVLDLTERRKQEQKFRLVVEAAPNGILMVDTHGYIGMANGQVCAMFGYDRQELLGQPVELLLPEPFRHQHRAYRRSFAQAPQSRPMGTGRELFGQRKDGSVFPVEIGLTPVAVEGDSFIVSTLVDITERKRAEEEIRLKNSQLSRLNEELTAFAHSVSHDLKVPLLAIQGLTRLSLEDIEANEMGDIQANLRRIGSEADKLRKLIEDVLALARVEADQEACTSVNLASIVGEIGERFQPLLKSEGVAFRADVPEGLSLFTHATFLRQILENLISNGIRYSDSGRAERFVEVSGAQHDRQIEIRVHDNGVGIPSECHSQVFGMFRRFHTHRAESSGLGLALVKKKVLRLGGSVEFESSPAGTTFLVRLPAITQKTCSTQP